MSILARHRIAELRADPAYMRARLWSNTVVREVGKHVEGDVVNISAWKDSDKNGGFYRDYFPHCSSYSTTNWGGTRADASVTDYPLDLEQALPATLRARFDFVLSHTTLEHVFNMDVAFDSHCAMTRRDVLIIVPFSQREHGQDYGDYWRFTRASLRRLLEARGLHEIFVTETPELYSAVYLAGLFSRSPESWHGLALPDSPPKVGRHVGSGGPVYRTYRQAARLFRR